MNYVDVFGSNRKRTISTRFLLPMLAEKNEKFSDFGQAMYWNSYGRFINAFMAMKDKPYLDSHIFLMFRIDEFDDTYYKNLFFLTKNKYFYSKFIYIDDEDTYYIFVFTIPNKYKKDYNCIKEGRYSQCSLELKQQVLSFWNLSSKSFTYALFNKSCRCGNKVFEQARVQDNGEMLPPPDIYEVIPEEIMPELSGIIFLQIQLFL